jgi:hypothetical protein
VALPYNIPMDTKEIRLDEIKDMEGVVINEVVE